jgi:riboflavin-specific deaminase-like protein
VDAVVVGAGTVAADNPRLTVRQVEGNNPVRVVLDPDGRLDRRSHIFTDGAARTIEVRRSDAQVSRDAPPAHPDVVRLSSDANGFEPGTILDTLRAQGLRRVLVEGGGVTVSRFLQAGSLDRLHVTVAPMLIGSGRPSLVLDPIVSLNDALRPTCRHFRLGDDMLFDLDLRAPTVS